MSKYIILITALSGLILMSSCSGNQSEEGHDEHGHGAESGHDENTNTATLTPEQIESIGIKYGSIEKKQLTSSLKLNGLLHVPNNNRASVTSLYGGVINTLSIQQGSTVKKAEVVATLTNASFITMQEEFLTISSKLTLAEIEFERQKNFNKATRHR
ncbi:MAG: hypothetical protein IPM74_16070 [Crocinitomicaceae bacterium]|nr:hypothetical protein [Crocinitomicaceae bacterium]